MGEPTTFIKLDRAILEHWISDKGPFDIFHAWIYIILNANYKEKKRYYKGTVQTVRRGELMTSERKLSEDWGWSKRRVHAYLDALESDGMVSLNRTADGTSIFVENYAKYQDVRTTDDTTRVTTRVTTGVTTEGITGGKHNKKDKKDKEREERKEGVLAPPSGTIIDTTPTPPDVMAELRKCIGGKKL